MAKKKKEQAAAKGAAPPAKPAAKPAGKALPPRLRDRYREEIVPRLRKEFAIDNVMAVPRLQKIVLNMGLGEATQNIKVLDDAVEELAKVAGQRPTVTRARKSVAAFKVREGMPIGCRVTLRGQRMWIFLDRLVAIALPRVRDFRGLPDGSFDGRGNYTLGIREQLIFPEINMSKVQKVSGMNVCIVTTAKTDEESRALLGGLGMPFRKN